MSPSWLMDDDLASAAVHGGGLMLTLLFGLYLLSRARTPLERLSIRALCAGWTVLYLASIGYHLADHHGFVNHIAYALDDSAIFVAIAATYTPIAWLALCPADGRLVLQLLWSGAAVALVGAALAAAGGFTHWYQPGVLVAGTMCGSGPGIAYCRTLKRALPRAAALLVLASGIVYLGGAYFYHEHSLPWHHSYWHAAVVLGCLLDFAAIAALLTAQRRPRGAALSQNLT